MSESASGAARTATRIVVVLAVLCVVGEFFVHRHAAFEFSAVPGFHAFFGFIAYCCIVLGAKSLRRWLHRPEDYYGD